MYAYEVVVSLSQPEYISARSPPATSCSVPTNSSGPVRSQQIPSTLVTPPLSSAVLVQVGAASPSSNPLSNPVRLPATQPRTSSSRVSVPRGSPAASPRHCAWLAVWCRPASWYSLPFSRSAGPPASPLHRPTASLPADTTSKESAGVPSTLNFADRSFPVFHSVAVRPNPASSSSSPAAGAVADRLTGATAVIGVFSRTSARSRCGCTTTVVATAVAAPTVTLVDVSGTPLCSAVLPVKQVEAVSTARGSTSTPVQARLLLPIAMRAMNANWPWVTSPPPTTPSAAPAPSKRTKVARTDINRARQCARKDWAIDIGLSPVVSVIQPERMLGINIFPTGRVTICPMSTNGRPVKLFRAPSGIVDLGGRFGQPRRADAGGRRRAARRPDPRPVRAGVRRAGAADRGADRRPAGPGRRPLRPAAR